MLSFLCALLPSLSICVFVYVRSLDSLSAYLEMPQWKLLFDAAGLRYIVVLLALTAVFHLSFRIIGQIRVDSLAVGLLLALNMVISLSMEHSDFKEIFLPGGVLCNLPVLLGFTLLCGVVTECIYTFCEHKRVNAAELPAPDKKREWLLFIVAFVIIAGCWIPWMHFCYPGSIATDTCSQILSWMGMEQIDASHPILCTIIYGSLFQFGLSLDNEGLGIFLCLVAQGLLSAAAMGLTAVIGYRHTRSKWWYCGIVGFFAVLPTWQNAAQIVLKDVLHTGCYVLFYLQYLKCLRERDKKSLTNVILLGICALLITYTRKATFYLAVISIAVLAILYWKRYLIPYLVCLAMVIGLFSFSNQVLYPMLNVREERESENYSLQFQQVALYCRTYQQEMSDEEIRIVNGTLNFETITAKYTPMISDPVKATYHGSAQDHTEFWNLYRRMLFRHPGIFVKALLMGSFEHLNPWFKDVVMRVYMDTDTGLIHTQYKNANFWDSARYWLSWLNIPVLRMLIGTGLYMWLFLIALGYTVRRKRRMAFLGLVPALMLFIGLFMSHVNGEIRYGYPMIASVPVFFPWILYAEKLDIRSAEPHDVPKKRNMRLKRLLEEYSQEEEVISVEGSEQEESYTEAEFDELHPAEEAESSHLDIGEQIHLVSRGSERFITRYIPVPKKPKAYLDLLKVLAIFLVLWNHTSNGFDLYNRVLEMPQHMLYLCFSIFDKIAVPLFFMCSGAVLLGREESVGTILKKRVWRFVWILLVVSGISYVMYYRNNADFSLYDFLVRLYSGNVLTPLWYLYSYLAMLLMLPFLRKLARTMRERDYFWLLGMYLLIQLISVLDFFWFHGERYHSSNFAFFINQNYLFFTLFGFYIDRVMKKERLNLETLTMLTMTSLLCIGATYLFTQRRMEYLGEWSSSTSQTFLNTLIAVPSITVFYIAKLWFTRHPASRRAATVWSLLGTGTFGVYLFERYWRNTAQFAFDYAIKKIGSFPSSLIHILVACILGIAATLAYKLVTGILKDIFNRFRKARDARMQERDALVYTVPAEDISDLEEIETLLNHPQQSGHVYERKDNEE